MDKQMTLHLSLALVLLPVLLGMTAGWLLFRRSRTLSGAVVVVVSVLLSWVMLRSLFGIA